ncbi:hypothetical protein [Methylobacterium nonmethylotrophicum]|uniref:Uncharacterized protein n=1 Tax=Methylobacterium nonmethylotrophicum TaxID=1141884 RepID=A0A4Z0NEH1_9HYPH|nr:hypothetical protein [Methylobacterium nonmethylotrophicum]TGD94067.1 hypothetical protein EU555_32620 [Methylobacterium nonmethylotrophicum]
MAASPFGFGRLWPVVTAVPDDEATPAGLAPGQPPVDPRRDGSVQPTAAGRNLSRAIGVASGNAAQSVLDAAGAPARAYRGELDTFDLLTGHVSDEAIGAAHGIAGLAMTGSLPMKVPTGAIRSFGGPAAKDADPLAALEAALGDLFDSPSTASAAAPTKPAFSAGPRPPVRVDPDVKAWDLYHGSKQGPDFQRFDPSLKQDSEAGAVFFAPEPTAAATYAGSPGVGDMVAGVEAGPRIFRTTVEPGKTAVFDIGHLAETDPAFNAAARAIYTQEASPRAGPLFDRYLRDFQASRTQDHQIAEQVRAMGAEPSPPTGASFGYGHIGAAIQRAKEQGLDTAILRGLMEHGGDDQVIALTPGRVRSHYAPDQLLYAGAPAAAGLAGAAALAPGDSQAAPSSSGVPPMAASARPFSLMPMVDEYGRPIPGTMPNAATSDPVPARAQAMQPQQEQPRAAPFSFGAPRGFGPGSAGASLPLPAAEPAPTGASALAAPARAAAAPARAQAPSRAMTSAPLPPPRPPEFGSSADPGQPLDIRPPAQAAAAPADPSTWDRISNFLGNNSDMLIGIGTGLLSTPGFGRGLAAGVQNGVAMQNASAAQGLARAKQAVEMQKFQQGQRNLTANAQYAKNHFARLGTPISDDFAMSVGSTPEVFNKILTGQFVAPEGYTRGPDGSLTPVRGGDKDPATIRSRAQAQAEGTAAGKPDETYTLLPEERRVSMGLPAGSYQVDSKNKISPVNPTGTTINMGAEKAQDATVGKGYGDYQLDLATKGRNAASTLNTLALMEQAMKTPGFYSGVGGEGVKRANQFLSALGVKDARAASAAEVFDALSNKVVLDGLGGSLGPGISNTDRDYIARTAPTLAQSEQGNRDLIGIARSLAQRQQAVSKLARDYAAKNGGRLDSGFDQALEDFAGNNPLFPQAAAGATVAPPQEPPRGLPQGARQARDGLWYAPDPNRPGKYLRVEQ